MPLQEEAEVGTRVLVNNQNTLRATVTLPGSASRARQKQATGNSVYAELKREGLSTPVKGVKDLAGASETGPALKNVKRLSGIMRKDVHPHLDDVYQRVMRRLQRKANYQEIGSPPLAVQFGIVDGADEERSRERVDVDSDDPHNSIYSFSSNGTGAKNGAAGRRHHGRGIPASAALAQGGNEADDDTFFLSQQPCPKTLRLVVEQVAATVTEKLRLAETGSLKNCLCLVFESRSLLERLLKEIPSYSQFQGEGERLPTAAQMQEMYQEFRQQPVVLPSARFEKEAGNGRVVASLFDNGACPLGPTFSADGEQSPPPQHPSPQQQQQLDLSGSQESTPPKKTGTSTLLDTPSFASDEKPKRVAQLGEVAVVIPATYARSPRMQQTNGHATRKVPGAASGSISRRQGSEGLPAKAASISHACGNQFDTKWGQRPACTGTGANGSPANTTATANAAAGGNVTASGLDADASTVAPRTSQFDTEKKRQATQVFSVGTLTDINSTSIVHREEYDQLQAYMKTLLVEIEERKRETRDLQEQLDEERDYTTQKRKVIQYLRETLYKECNILRSQLSLAQQKHIQYQSLVKEQQQALAHAATAMNTDGRSMASVSTCEGTRFPNISTTRFNQNDIPNLAMSLSPGLQSFRRTNANISALALTRSSAHVDEIDDGNGSVVGTTLSAGAGGQQISIEITAIQSLLDLVMLAVENDQLIPGAASRGNPANVGLLAHHMADDRHRREENLKKEFAEKQRQAKQNYSLGRTQLTVLLALKEQQINEMKKFSDVHFLRSFWDEKCNLLRAELRRVRKAVQEDLESLRQFIITSMEAIARRTHVVDASLTENHTLFTTQSALRDVIFSAQSLLVPMLTTQYERGYHPWPLKLRNTADPFGRMIKARYGEGQALLLREEINALGSIYMMLHHYVMKNLVSPVMKRPLPGRTLRNLCALLAMNNCTSAEVWMQVREKYTRDMEFQKSIAALNMSVVSLMYRQRIVTERSAEAMQEAGMDPRLSGLPAQRTINLIAERLHKVIADRAALRKQRQENARDVYRIWKKRQIDVYEGYPPPSLPQRLVVAEMDANVHSALLTVLPTSNRGHTNSQTHSSLSAKKSISFWNHMLSTSNEGVASLGGDESQMTVRSPE